MPPYSTLRALGSSAPKALVALLLAVFAALPAPAQDIDQETTRSGDEAPPSALRTGFDDLIEVSEVFVDVLATDAEGEVVRDLGLEDFVVEENGEPVELTGVSYYTTRYGDRGVEGDDVPSSRYLVIFLDDRTRFGRYGPRLMRQQLRAVRDAKRWVREEKLPSDWLAVVSYDTELHVQQDFTQNPELLEEALERAAAGKEPRQFRPGKREAVARGRQLSILGELPVGPELERRTENVYGALEVVSDALGYLVGRKVMLLYTVGFGVRKGRSSVPDERYYPSLQTSLNDHNVAVYPIDLTPSGLPPEHEDFLARLAEDTGGFYDPNFSGFFRPLEDVASENFGYYLLTYRSARPAGEIGYQELEVRAKDPAINVRARTGYRYGL